MGEPVEIGVPDLGIGVIDLNQREGRRGHILVPPLARQPRLNERSREMGLARADLTLEQQRVSRPDEPGKGLAQMLGRIGVGQVYRQERLGHGPSFSACPVRRKAN